MPRLFRSAWSEVLIYLFRRPPALQLAALCWRDGSAGREILLVTSSNGRWILPKGWPISGLDGRETALREAWEEAGVRQGIAAALPIASFNCKKINDHGQARPCLVQVYPVEVTETVAEYPESEMRERRWVSTSEALELVDEPGLRSLIHGYAQAA